MGKLTKEQQKDLRKIIKEGSYYTNVQLAKDFGLSSSALYHYLSNSLMYEDIDFREKKIIEHRRYVEKNRVQLREKERTRYSESKIHRNQKIKTSKIWYQENKSKHSKNVLNNYYKNKDKWKSRNNTLRILKSKKYSGILYKKCNHCPNLKDLQIHHEIYPAKTKEIIKAIEDWKIYYLCKKCHLKIDKNKKLKI